MNIGLEFDSVLLFGLKGLLVNVYWDFLHYNADWRDLAVLYQNHFTWQCAAAGFTCRAELDDFLWSAITTWAQKLLERFNLTYFYCSNKQSGCSQMQKMLLNNWSLRLIWWNIMIWEDTWTMAALHPVMTVTRMFVAVVKTDPNRRTLMCMQFFTNLLNVKWNKPKTKDGVYPCTNTHTHTRAWTHTFNWASHLSNNSTAGTSFGLSELTDVWICCNSFRHETQCGFVWYSTQVWDWSRVSSK